MAVSTVRPNTLVKRGTWVGNGGTTNDLHTKTSDDSDTTYINAQTGQPSRDSVMRMGLGNPTVTAGQRILRARIRARCQHNGTGTTDQMVGNAFYSEGTTPDVGVPIDHFHNYPGAGWKQFTGGWRSHDPLGREWSSTMANAIQVYLIGYFAGGGGANFARTAEVYADFDIRDRPTVSGVTVTGNLTSSRPLVTFTYNANADGDDEIAWQAKAFTAAQYGIAGFDPNSSPNSWDSGQVGSSDQTFTVGKDLINAVTYKVYVRAAQDFNGARWFSDWVASSSFTMGYEPIPAPTLTVASDNTVPHLRNLLTVDSKLNLLTSDDASFEAGVGSWTAVTNCTVTASATFALKGAQSLRLSSSGAGDMVAATPGGVFGYPVRPNTTYVILGSWRAGATTRSARLEAATYDEGGTQIGGTIAGSNISATSAGFTQAILILTTPAGCGRLLVAGRVVACAGAAELFYLDAVSLQQLTNRMTPDNAGFEVTAGTWAANGNMIAPARTTAQAKYGIASLLLQSSAAGDMSARHVVSGSAGFPVRPGLAYTAGMSFRAATAGRSSGTIIAWYDSTSSLLSSNGGTYATSTTTGWTDVLVAATAPANAAFAVVIADILATAAGSEQHYIDATFFAEGDRTTWFAGGISQIDYQLIEATDLVTAAAPASNLLHPQVASAGEQLNGTDGFFVRSAKDLVTFDRSQALPDKPGEGCIRWDVGNSTGSLLDIGTVLAGFDATYTAPCVPGTQYTASVYVQALAGTHSLRLVLTSIDQAGVVVGSATNGSTNATIAQAWQRLTVTHTAQAGAVGLRPALENVNGDLASYFLDGLQLEEGATATVWGQGQGQAPAWLPVRGALTALKAFQRDGIATIYDREAPPGVIRLYRAFNMATYASGDTGQSPVSTYVAAKLTIPAGNACILKDPQQPAHDLSVRVVDPMSEGIEEDIGEFHPVRPNAVQAFGQRPLITSDWRSGQNGTLGLWVTDEAIWWALLQLLESAHPLLVQWPEGGQRYIRITGDRSWSRTLIGPDGAAVRPSRYLREVTFPFKEVNRPVVLE